jgi:hypothetical protein
VQRGYTLKYLIFIILLNCGFAQAGSLYEQDCSGDSGFSVGNSVFLNIDTAFNGQTNFQLRKVVWEVTSEGEQPKSEIEYSLIVKNTNTVTNDKQRTSTRTTSCDNLKISQSEYEKILNLFKDALKVNFFDNVMGLDGSIWCMEINGLAIQERNFCFWSPEHESKQRGLEGLASLGRYLFKFTDLKINKVN